MPNFTGNVIAFDFGHSRIGVANGHTQIGVAHPLATITGKNNSEKFSIINNLIREWQPEILVVGLPMHLDGTEHEMTLSARKFAKRLKHHFKLPVCLVDERLTSVVAEQKLTETSVFGKKRKLVLDQVAAMAILETFFISDSYEIVIDEDNPNIQTQNN